MIFLNISNHPSSGWSPEQLQAARELAKGGDVVDVPFPAVPPEASRGEVYNLAEQTLAAARAAAAGGEVAGAMVMGEFTLTMRLVDLLEYGGIACYAATTQRVVVDGRPVFRFVQFRSY